MNKESYGDSNFERSFASPFWTARSKMKMLSVARIKYVTTFWSQETKTQEGEAGLE